MKAVEGSRYCNILYQDAGCLKKYKIVVIFKIKHRMENNFN